MKFKQQLILLILPVIIAGCGESVTANLQAALTDSQSQGKIVFKSNCASCHATTPDMVIVGPSLSGVAVRTGENSPPEEARFYIETSILNPDAAVVDGFQNLMPKTFGKTLSGEEFDSLVDYLMTLK